MMCVTALPVAASPSLTSASHLSVRPAMRLCWELLMGQSSLAGRSSHYVNHGLECGMSMKQAYEMPGGCV